MTRSTQILARHLVDAPRVDTIMLGSITMGGVFLVFLAATVAVAHGNPTPSPTPNPTRCGIEICPVIQCERGAEPVTPEGECCPRCTAPPSTPPPTNLGPICAEMHCTEIYEPVCVTDSIFGNLTYPNVCEARNCRFHEGDWTRGECGARPCDPDRVISTCPVPICRFGAPFTPEGECCPQCPSGPICETGTCPRIYSPVCVTDSIFGNLTYPNVCEAQNCGFVEGNWTRGVCRARECDAARCPYLSCMDGADPVTVRGECCPRCPSRPLCDDTFCAEIYSPVCVTDGVFGNLTYPSDCYARSCGFEERNWTRGVCGARLCDVASCPVPTCLVGEPFTPSGECCPRCPTRPACNGTAICPAVTSPVCVSSRNGNLSLTYENECVATNCGFNSSDWTEGPCQVPCEPGWGPGRGLVGAAPIGCHEAICRHGEPFTPEGQCCPQCPVPCEDVVCPAMHCRGGVPPVTQGDDCCPTCPDPCDLVRCAAQVCDGGAEAFTPDGECCARCPETFGARPFCNRTISSPAICTALYDPVCVDQTQTFPNSCMASICGNRNWTEGACTPQQCDDVPVCPALQCEGGAEPLTPEGDCCPKCPDPCDIQVCPFELCEGGAFPVAVEGECCPSCRGTISGPHASYCPDGYADLTQRFDWPLGKIVIVDNVEQCSARCDQYSGERWNGGCKGYQTGFYFGMQYCRSYGGNVKARPCAPWANPNVGGISSGALGSVHPRTNRVIVGGSCCVRKEALFFDGTVKSAIRI